MANPFVGYNVLGHALAGGNAPNAALMEAQGESLGANTENAIAQANERIAKNKALADPQLKDKLAALAGGNQQVAEALHGLLQAGIVNPENVLKAIGENQKNAGTAIVADPHSTDEQVARAQLARDPQSAGLIRPTAQGEASTNILHPDQGVNVTELGRALVPAKLEESRAHAALYRNEAEHPEKYHFPPVGGQPLDSTHSAMATELVNAGWMDNATRFNMTPQAIEVRWNAMHSGNFNPGGAAHNTLQAQEKDFSGEGKNGQRIRAGNAINSHLKVLQSIADAQDASDLPTVQKYTTMLTGEAGGDFAANNKLVSNFVGRELDGFLSAGNPTLQGHTEAQALVNPSDLGAHQLRTNVELGRKLMGGQFGALKQTYASAPGRTPEDVAGFSGRFLGGNRDILDDFEKEHGEIKPSGGRAPLAAAPAAAASAAAAAPAAPGGLPPGWTVETH
jgi:hypothetical protein